MRKEKKRDKAGYLAGYNMYEYLNGATPKKKSKETYSYPERSEHGGFDKKRIFRQGHKENKEMQNFQLNGNIRLGGGGEMILKSEKL